MAFVLSSMSQDEEMDTTPLGQPFFAIDKEKGMGSGDEEKRDGDDIDSGQDEDPNCPADEEDGDDEVSATKKASSNNGRMENGESTKTNGNHHSESEESSEEEDVEGDEKVETTEKVVKCLPVPSTPQCQTFASWQGSSSW